MVSAAIFIANHSCSPPHHHEVYSSNTCTVLHHAVPQVLSKLVTAPGTDIHVSTHLLGCMEVLASPATDPQAVAVCGGVLATKPPLVPWLLKQLEQSAGGSGLAAAALCKHLLDVTNGRQSLPRVKARKPNAKRYAWSLGCFGADVAAGTNWQGVDS